MSEYVENARFKLEEAKYYYEQMKINFQDRTKFLFSLDAFLSAARTVTWVFKKGLGKMDQDLVKLYGSKVNGEWKADEVMRLLVEMRNVSIKEHAPQMRTTIAKSFAIDFVISDSISVKKVSSDGKTVEIRNIQTETRVQPQSQAETQAPPASGVVSYSFHDLPGWFDQDSDVMRLCEEWLSKLESFVIEAEKLSRTSEIRS